MYDELGLQTHFLKQIAGKFLYPEALSLTDPY